jgi:hypothetical protein
VTADPLHFLMQAVTSVHAAEFAAIGSVGSAQ